MPSLLPQEILREIICHLHNDKYALKRCSLASPSFTAVCQSRLFSKVILRRGTASNFKQVLNTSPHIAGYVACLEIFDTDRAVEGSKKEWVSKDDALAPCLLQLTRLKALIITYRTDDKASQWPADLQQCLEKTMKIPSLVCLELTGYPLTLLEQGGAGLKHLALRSPSSRFSDTKSPWLSIADTAAARVQPLSLALDSEDQGIESLICLALKLDLSKLKRLGVNASLGNDHDAVAQLLQVCAGTLEELIFYPCYSGQQAVYPKKFYPDPINLSILTSLRRLTIHVDMFEDRKMNNYYDSFPWLLSFLSRLANSSTNNTGAGHLLEELNIHVSYDNTGQTHSSYICTPELPDIDSWWRMARLLAASSFPNLQKVTFELSSWDESASLVLEDLREAGYISSLREGLEVRLFEGNDLEFKSHTLFAPDANHEWAGYRL
ncbi:hypothetical protein NLJ89_g9399 [Agrocybe chaxingu]|uniref:F-box domain-containing protein n=1 Tax=Agrocybe chaxingu TaxID=84603 RepID=A0A9W8MRV5_9AGAR|nr:hypothetical protein NLJ89_g9399 [Agrocybe chaxingu]